MSVILHPPPSLCYCLALWCFALGLLSKPVLVTLPLVMLLLDCWPLKRAGRVRRLEAGETPVLRLLLEKIPFLLLAAGSALATFLVHQETGAFTALGEMPMPLRLENGFVACARYLGKTFWPADLAVLYPHPGNWPAALVFFSAVLVLGVSAVAVWQGRRRPYVLTGWFWFLAMLLPVLGIIQWGVQSMADRFTYLPLAGVFVMLVWGAAEVCVLWGVRGWALLTVAAVVLSACGAQTRRQLAHWRNSEALFRHTLAVTRNNAVAWNNLGIYLSATGRSAEAEDCFRKAVEIEPGFAFALNNYGMALVARGRVQEAIGCYRRAIELIPDNPEALRNLAAALVEIKEYAEAISCYEASLRLEPAQADTRAELGGVLLKTGRRTEAASSYWEALRLNPDYAEAHYRLGVILLGDGDKTGAMAHWRTAARLAPESPEALNSLAWALATGSDSKLRDGAEAVALANRAVQATRSKSPGVLDTLAAAYAEAGRFGEAVTTAQQALNLASAAGKEPLAKEIQTHLNEYKAGRPHRE